MTGERIVLPSANPQAAYANAVAVAAKGGWLPAPAGKPAERRKDSKAGDLLKAQTEQGTHQLQVLQLTFAMKRSDVPLLKNALAAAGLQAAEEKSARVGAAEEQTGTVNGALRPASAPAGADLDQTRSRANAAPAEMKAPQVVVSAPAVGPQRQWAEPAAQPPETATYQLGARKAEAAEEPLVQVTLLFPLAESPVPARPAAAGAAGSVTPE